MSVDGATGVGVHRQRRPPGRSSATRSDGTTVPAGVVGPEGMLGPDISVGLGPPAEPGATGDPEAAVAGGRTVRPADVGPRAEFHAFFEQHHRELARFAYLLTGDHDAADDLTAEALTAAWSRWDRVSTADSPLAYVRRIVANLATSRLRRVIRERRGMTLLGMLADRAPENTDVPAAMDLRTALMALPAGKRACVVLRYAFDLSESETAKALGVSVGTVKSQTSKAVAELERLLGARMSTLDRQTPRRDARRSRYESRRAPTAGTT